MKKFTPVEQLYAADLNQNFKEARDNWNSFTYGENIAVNDALYISDGQERTPNNIEQISHNSSFSISSIFDWIAQTFKTSSDCVAINKVSFLLRTTSTGLQDVRVSIRATSNGVPTGSNLAICTISIPETPNDTWFDWHFNFTVTPNTTYALCFHHSVSTGSSTHTRFQNTDVYANGNMFNSVDRGTSWTSHPTNDVAFKVEEAINAGRTIGRVYKTDAKESDARVHNFIGFAKEPGIANNVKEVQIGGIVDIIVTAGKYYYLSNTPGAISITPGTYTKRIGIAMLSNKLFLTKQQRLEYFEVHQNIFLNPPSVDWHIRTFEPNAVLDISFRGSLINNRNVHLRELGSTRDRKIGRVNNSTSITGRVKTDKNGRFQIRGHDTTANIIGYWKET